MKIRFSQCCLFFMFCVAQEEVQRRKETEIRSLLEILISYVTMHFIIFLFSFPSEIIIGDCCFLLESRAAVKGVQKLLKVVDVGKILFKNSLS